MDLTEKDRQGRNCEKEPLIDDAYNYVQTIDKTAGGKDYLLELRQHPLLKYSDERWYSYSYLEFIDGDIIDISVKSDGRYIICRIPKLKDLNNIVIYNGFKALTYKDKIKIFYNDNEDNVDSDLPNKPVIINSA